MAEFENFEKRLRSSRTTDHRKNVSFAELARLVDEQKDHWKNVFEPRGLYSAETLQDTSERSGRGALRARERMLSGDFDAIEGRFAGARRHKAAAGSSKVAKSFAFPGANDKPEHQRYNDHKSVSRLVETADEAFRPQGQLYVMATIIVVGIAGLVASSGFFSKAFSPAEIAAIKGETELAKLRPERTTGADLQAQNTSIFDPSPAALVNNAEHPVDDTSQAQVNAPPTGVLRNDHGPATEPASVSEPLTQTQSDPEQPHGLLPTGGASLQQATATAAPLPPSRSAAAAPASTPETAARVQTTLKPAAAKLGDLGYPASALEELVHTPRTSFDDAPPLDLGSSPQPSKDSEVEKELKPSHDEYIAKCFVKVDERVRVNGSCQVLRTKATGVTFKLAESPVTISYEHGRTWTATLGSRDLGKVYKRGLCWGSRRVYICEHDK